MPNIKPVSDLRNYGTVLKDVSENCPVLLTKNGRGEYALIDINDYNEYMRLKALARLNSEIELAHKRGEEEGWIESDEAFRMLRKG